MRIDIFPGTKQNVVKTITFNNWKIWSFFMFKVLNLVNSYIVSNNRNA